MRTATASLVAAIGLACGLAGCAAPGRTTLAGVPVPTVDMAKVPMLSRFAKPNPALAMYPGGTQSGEAPFDDIGYATWDPVYEPPYRFYVGDEVEMSAPGAPEINKTVTVGQDGRATFPYVGEVMMTDRTLEDVRGELRRRYAVELRNPNVQLSAKSAPVKIFVGGEVNTPNAYDLVGDGNAFNAVIQAGGFKSGADLKHVFIIRRGKGGAAMMRTADLSEALRHGWQPDLVPLRRNDIVYVPRSGIAKVGLFMQQYFRDALPVQFTYAVGKAYVAQQPAASP